MKTNSTSQFALFILRIFLGVLLCSVGILLIAAGFGTSATGTARHAATAQTAGAWKPTGSMSVGRQSRFTATLLTSGKVLVAGGCLGGSQDPYCHTSATAGVEVYDPSTGLWTSVHSMATPRIAHTATLLANGKVLVAGGEGAGGSISSAEVYDPVNDTWAFTGSMSTPRVADIATLITTGPLSGKVLVAGGSSVCANCTPLLDSAELYDPNTGTWSLTGDMNLARDDFNSPDALPDGSVFVVGGITCCPYHWFNRAETYDPVTQSWTSTSGKTTPANGPAVILPNGKILVAGGTRSTQPTSVNVASAELFEPSTGAWSPAASMSIDRAGHTVVLLPGGQALVAGGYSGGWGVCNDDLASAEIYDPNTDTWSPTGSMKRARANHTATTLPDGQVLVAGGSDCEGNILSSAELYTPATTNDSCMPPPAGLVSWWGGDEDSSDLQGSNDGILMNGATYAAGVVSRAGFSFDGVDDGVQVGDTPSLKMTTAVTLECWVFPTGSKDDAIIANREGEYEFARWLDGTIQWAFANTDPGWTWINTGFVAPLWTWTHVAITYDNGLITTYGNGVQVHQYSGSGPIGDFDPTRNDFRIGNRQQFGEPFPGSVDELKIYNRALSSSEVAAIYDAGSSGNCKPEVFVQDISPYAVPKAGGVYKVGTTIKILDALAHSMSDATVRVTVRLPDGGSFSDAVTTDSDGNADYSIFSSTHGTYVFRVELVRKPGRQYSRQSNVETRDEITIP